MTATKTTLCPACNEPAACAACFNCQSDTCEDCRRTDRHGNPYCPACFEDLELVTPADPDARYEAKFC